MKISAHDRVELQSFRMEEERSMKKFMSSIWRSNQRELYRIY